jgi:hypothetical protein
MPKATVNEYDFATRRKDKVGLSRKVFSVEPEPVSQAVNQAAKC